MAVMNIKRRVVNETIKRIEKRVKYLKGIIYANPASEIIQCRIAARKILEEHKGDYKKIGELIDPLAKKEKKLFALSKKQEKSCDMIDEQVKLENELYELRNEIYFMDKRERA